MEKARYMCPHCGLIVDKLNRVRLIPIHSVRGYSTGMTCPGSQQHPRNAESDKRPLWKDLPESEDPPHYT